MKSQKKKIVVGIITVLMLIFVYWWGGDSPGLRGWNLNTDVQTTITQDNINYSDNSDLEEQTDDVSVNDNNLTVEEINQQSSDSDSVENSTGMVNDEQDSQSQTKNEDTGFKDKDGHKRDTSSQSTPEPIEPNDVVISDKELTCTLSVRCDTIRKNIDWLDKGKIGLIPENNIIYPEQTVTFYEGESVFNLLVREMKRNEIHLEFENTPIYNSAYIEGIGNLYEFDCGELSGWMYKVNDWFPNYGCSRYRLQSGDKVEWVYTCDLGKDVGGNYSSKNGR